MLKEADSLEKYAKQQQELARTEKKKKGVREARVFLRATKKWLEELKN